MMMGIEQESRISIFAAAGWVEEIDASHDTRKWAGEQAEAAFPQPGITSAGVMRNIAKLGGGYRAGR
jgi:hypothetical protein